MENNIENKILNDLIDLNKTMYEPAEYPHICGLCQEPTRHSVYRKKLEYVKDWQQPYLFICKECYEDLPDGEKRIS